MGELLGVDSDLLAEKGSIVCRVSDIENGPGSVFVLGLAAIGHLLGHSLVRQECLESWDDG